MERYDYARGLRFSTYALFWIRAFVGAATARHLGALNLPAWRAELLRVAQGVVAQLSQDLRRDPTTAEVAAAMGRSEAWTAELMAYQRPQALDATDLTSLDAVMDLPAPSEAADLSDVRGLLGTLEAHDRRVLELRLGFESAEPCSLAETARLMRMSVGRVRRIEARAIEALRSVCPQQASALLSG